MIRISSLCTKLLNFYFRILCETIKDFITRMGSLHSEATVTAAEGIHAAMAAAASESCAESINQKCRILSEKLDQLLSTLQEEASPEQTTTGSIDESEDPAIPEGVDPSVRLSKFMAEWSKNLCSISIFIGVPTARRCEIVF